MTIYLERGEYWFYQDSKRIFISEHTALKLVKQKTARIIDTTY